MPSLPQYDPLGIPAPAADIRKTWLEILELPVAANDGKIFQYDEVSERLMNSAVVGWTAAGLTTMDWRLDDNTTVPVDKPALESYISQLQLNRSLRGFVVDGEYVAFKASGATVRQLVDWKESYMP